MSVGIEGVVDIVYTIIIVEDEHKIAQSLARNIELCEMDFEVIALVANGEQALEIIKKKAPNVLITDIRMPVMDGLELVSKVDKTYPEILKIIVSGYDNFSYAQNAISYHVEEYLLKPVIKNDVEEVLKKIKLKLDVKNKNFINAITNKNIELQTMEELIDFVELYINTNYMKDVNIKELVESRNYNFVYFGRKYNEVKGITPYKYLTKLRLNKAYQLLENNEELNIREISEAVGYNDSAYFCRIFKNHMGVTPTEIRKKK